MEGSDDVSVTMTQSQTDVCGAEVGGGGEIPSKVDNGVNPPAPADSCGSGATGLSKGGLSNLVEPPAPSVVSPAAESPGGVALKVATTVLHPCAWVRAR